VTVPPDSDDLRRLTPTQLDALREVANIGAGHAATALSQMTGSRIMISVPVLRVVPLASLAVEVADPTGPVVAIQMAMLGDLAGRTLLVFPHATALALSAHLTRRPAEHGALTPLGESALKETGNILSGAYLSALSEFLGMVLLNSPPVLDMDIAVALAPLDAPSDGSLPAYALCVESEIMLTEPGAHTRGYFLLLPDTASLRAILRAIQLA
jgi:chemotaxis protein CheC